MFGRVFLEGVILGSIMGLYCINNVYWGGFVKLGFNFNGFFIQAQYSYQDFVDYWVLVEIFDYNIFRLFIIDERFKNMVGNECIISVIIGFNCDWGIICLIFSCYQLEVGLFLGVVGIFCFYVFIDDGNCWDIDIFKQEVEYMCLSLYQDLVLLQGYINFNIGYQWNLWQEFFFLEFYSIFSL